jgi:hypothetical protein
LAQVQKKFFVDDVISIEYVTVNYCVNDAAQIDEVTIVSDKTTYDNTYNIEELKQYLLTIEFYSDSKLRNGCYNSTFEFINSSYQKKRLTEEESSVCKNFHKGVYEYKHVLFRNTKIKRGRRIQRELEKENKQIYYIKWLSDNEYVLTYKRMTAPRFKHLIGKEIYVEIIDVLDDGSYVYRSKPSFEERIDYGVIKKVR